MISSLRSIDNLLNHFDELTKCHANILANFSDVKISSRNISRAEDEQRKSRENIVLDVIQNDDKYGTIGSLEGFHRRFMKIPYLHRPSYSSNDALLIHCVSSRSSF
jgi:hypothetical protein